jgi:cyclophilin family peptidyl-prolyl cis-trans isomerase
VVMHKGPRYVAPLAMKPRALVLALLVATVVLPGGCAPRARGSGSPPAAPREAPLTLPDVVALELGRAPTAGLARALEPSAPAQVRARGALALARAERVDTAPVLLGAMHDDNAEVRRQVAFGLGQLDLALLPGHEGHDALRATVEQRLVDWLQSEAQPAVRVSLLRALGRLASEAGLARLLDEAERGPERVVALYALGVSGARRGSSLQGHARLATTLRRIFSEGPTPAPPALQRAAAYAAFRQKVPLTPEELLPVLSSSDAQTRIHAARALRETTDRTAPAAALLKSEDWRVRVEGIRALEHLATQGRLAAGPLGKAAVAAAKALAAGALAEQHVVAAACDALANPAVAAPPDELFPHAQRVLAAIPEGEAFTAARCRCAVATDALRSRPDDVRRCAPSWPKERVRRLDVEVAARARLSSRERAAWLAGALKDEAPAVRMAAAFALGEDGSRHEAKLAASRLVSEPDAAVAAALLLLFAGQRGDLLDDAALLAVAERFLEAKTLEEAEPLLAVAALARGRTTPIAEALAARLRSHDEPRVRERIDGVPHGERSSGPRATQVPPPAPGELPLAVVLRTERGPMTLAFERELAPVTVASFARLARAGFYDGLPFHRVVSDFVTQGGDPRGIGSGGPGFTLPCENSDAAFDRGAVGMALAGKDTGGSQFFLTHSEQPHLDGRYTLFARVTDGLDVMDALMPDDRIVGVDFVAVVPRRTSAHNPQEAPL